MLWNGKCLEIRDISLQKHGTAHPSFRTAPPNGNGYLWSAFEIMSRLLKRRNSPVFIFKSQMPSKMPGIEKSWSTRWMNEEGKEEAPGAHGVLTIWQAGTAPCVSHRFCSTGPTREHYLTTVTVCNLKFREVKQLVHSCPAVHWNDWGSQLGSFTPGPCSSQAHCSYKGQGQIQRRKQIQTGLELSLNSLPTLSYSCVL